MKESHGKGRVRTDKGKAQRLFRPRQLPYVPPADGQVWVSAQLLQCLIIRQQTPLQSCLCSETGLSQVVRYLVTYLAVKMSCASSKMCA